MAVKDYRPSHTDTTALAVGIIVSFLVNLLTSLDFNLYLLAAILFATICFVFGLLYYLITKKTIRIAEGRISYKEEEEERELSRAERLKEENLIWDKAKKRLTPIGYTAVIFGILGLLFTIAWRCDIYPKPINQMQKNTSWWRCDMYQRAINQPQKDTSVEQAMHSMRQSNAALTSEVAELRKLLIDNGFKEKPTQKGQKTLNK